ncbi:DMT family transporter [Rhodococcus sp. NPDC003322]
MTARARAWAFLAAAITSEIIATVLLASTEQFTRPALSLVVIAGYVTSFACMAQALRTLPVSLTYALWSGIGTAAVAVIGVVLLGEPLSIAKVAGLALIVAGVVVLNLGGDHHDTAVADSAQAVPPGDHLLDEPAGRDPA